MAGIPGAVRARHMKTLVAGVDALPAADAAAVRARVGPAALAQIADSAGPEWLPLELNAALTRALHDALGVQRSAMFFRARLGEALRAPLFKAVHDGAVALFGLDPSSWLKLVPRGWELVFRGCGAWSKPQHTAPGVAEIELRELPPLMTSDRVWPVSVAASLSALVDAGKAQGAMELTGFDAKAGRASYVLRWSAKG